LDLIVSQVEGTIPTRRVGAAPDRDAGLRNEGANVIAVLPGSDWLRMTAGDEPMQSSSVPGDTVAACAGKGGAIR